MNYEKEKVCGWHDAHIGLCTSVIKMLRKRKLIEGRNPHLYVSKRIFMKNLRPVRMKIPLCTDLYDFCPLGHSFFSHHIATYREHHFQS